MLSHRFDGALGLAASLHRRQTRKGSDIPYISHLMAVSALVLEYGGDEDQAIAGLLHDAVEDQGGVETANRIRDEFGERVAQMVLACSDSTEEPKPDWKVRKDRYLDGIATKSRDALLVTAADKLHNVRTILADHRIAGDAVFERFTAKRDGTLWYYTELSRRLSSALPGPLTDELRRTVALLRDQTDRAVNSGG